MEIEEKAGRMVIIDGQEVEIQFEGETFLSKIARIQAEQKEDTDGDCNDSRQGNKGCSQVC